MATTGGRRTSPLAKITPTSPPEPAAIAIVGMGCRFPGGADSPATYWDFLTAGGDALVDIPGDRWLVDKFYAAGASVPGLSRVRRGGFLTQPVDQFDAAFFGISPREADYIDPQQRLLLEVAWEALEDAGATLERAKRVGSVDRIISPGELRRFRVEAVERGIGRAQRALGLR